MSAPLPPFAGRPDVYGEGAIGIIGTFIGGPFIGGAFIAATGSIGAVPGGGPPGGAAPYGVEASSPTTVGCRSPPGSAGISIVCPGPLPAPGGWNMSSLIASAAS